MATSPSVKALSLDLTVLETQWVRKSLDTQVKVLQRSLRAELPGSDIARLRQGEIDSLLALMARCVL